VGDLFDKLAKDTAADLPRREAFRRLGGGLLAVALAAVGLAARDKDECRKICFDCCDFNHSRPKPGKDGGGQEHAQCIQDCHDGVGVCWPALPGLCG
jgi:hypothetical protein